MLQENNAHLHTSIIRWGGFLESLETCREVEEFKNPFIQNLKKKITLLENCKNVEEIESVLPNISEMERNYLNSPLLDEIFETTSYGHPFLNCCEKNKLNALKFYIEKEGFIEKNLCLTTAAMHGSFEVAKFLLENGADVKYQNYTAFILACSHGHKKIIELLIKNGVNIKDNESILCAIDNNHIEAVKVLLKNGVYKSLQGPLMLASEKGFTSIVAILLGYGANVNTLSGAAIRFASEFGHTETVSFLIEHGADVRVVNDDALRSAARNGHAEIVRILLENGANVSADDDASLKDACYNMHNDVIKILIEYGADIHANYEYPLRTSCYSGNIEIVELLLKNGANPNGNGNDWLWYKSTLELAISRKHKEIIALLLEYRAVPTYWDKIRLFMQKCCG